MADQIVSFDFSGFEVRALGTWDAPVFIAADVCRVLGIANISDACSSLDEDEKGIATVDTPGGAQDLLHVTESGLYSLVLRSRKRQAKAFKKWITSDVLPSIRKNGRFEVAPQPQLESEAIPVQATPVAPAVPMTQAQALLAAVGIIADIEQKQIRQDARQDAIEQENHVLRERLLTTQQQLQVIQRQQLAAQEELLALPPSARDVPQESTDMKIRRMVNNYCAATGGEHRKVWNDLYQQFNLRYHRIIKPMENESKLQCFIRLGLIEALYALSVDMLASKTAIRAVPG
jgi:prophage antirepressor-like protein